MSTASVDTLAIVALCLALGSAVWLIFGGRR
jgi:hypothetical protein